jgi:hypothetical protein
MFNKIKKIKKIFWENLCLIFLKKIIKEKKINALDYP